MSCCDVFVEADMIIQIIAKFIKVERNVDLIISWRRYSYSYKIFFMLICNGFIIMLR